MTNVVNIEEAKKKNSEVIEVATNHLTLHSKQESLSPNMSDKQWKKFVNGIKENGVLQPISVTKGFRIIDGKHRLLAAKELGIEGVRVVIEDIPENEVATYIVENKLNRSELKNGQRAAMVIRLYYDELSEEARGRRNSTLHQNSDSPNLDERKNARTDELLAKKAGIGKSSMAYLIAVYRNRLDLFERVFDGTMSINKAYTQMKSDEEPEEQEEVTPSDELRNRIEKQIESDSSQPQYDENEHELSPRNKSVRLRKEALSMSAKILDEATTIDKTKEDVRNSTRKQLLSLATSCFIALGQTSKDQDEQDLLYMGMELLKKIEGDD